MARYYFDSRDGDDFVRDEIGLEFRSLQEAEAECARALAELAIDVLPGAKVRILTIEVRDEDGDALFESSLRFEVKVLKAKAA